MIARLLAGAALVVGVGLATPAFAGGTEPHGGCNSLPTVVKKGDAPALLSLPPKEGCKPPVRRTPPVVWDNCANLKGWYVNPDETTRKPEATIAGLKFTTNKLIHHATALDVKDLHPGIFTAHPAPDQDSFFSVEVSGSDGGYGTLRWNTHTHKWNLVTGGAFYENTSAAALVDMPTAHRSHHVVSFGVGYTNSPPGTVATVVSSVRFNGKTWPLTCHPTPTVTKTVVTPVGDSGPCAAYVYKGTQTNLCHDFPGTKDRDCSDIKHPVTVIGVDTWRLDKDVHDADKTGCEGFPPYIPPVTHSTSATPSKSSATPVQGNAGGSDTGTGALAVTGPPVGILAGLGALVLAAGGGLFYLSRRRRNRFVA